ncbi:MAG: two-component system response regulator [Candidatus Omnitrophota bacterium]|nr:MAG: two-component system response regulator [Candidatus Omnitrophota bacterium]
MSDLKILVVDDSSTMRRIIKNTLARLGYSNVVEAEHGIDGLGKLKEGDFSLILTDWNMPEMDGLTFVKSVRGSDTFKHIPIIMVTTEAAKTEVVEALKQGVNDYVVKPFTPDALKAKLSKFIS